MIHDVLITVVVPVFNQVHLTQRCLDSLKKNSHLSLQLVVVDNASTDETAHVLESYKAIFSQTNISFEVITNEKNVGFGRAMNQGARLARGAYVALLNNDTWLMPGWDKALVESIRYHQADMIYPYYYEGSFIEENMDKLAQSFIQKNAHKKTKEWGSILMFFNLERFKEIGMFDEDYFVTYEDTDLRERCDRKGYKYYLVGDCFIWHFSKGTRDKDSRPSKLEEQGLSIFMGKWGFDPRLKQNSFFAKQIKSFRKWKRRRGLL